MDKIFEPTADFQFHTITMCNPVVTNGGAYFIKFLMNESSPLYVQAPPCESRNGIVNANRRCFIDLNFSENDRMFIQWLEDLETHCHNMIYDNREKWFEGSLEKSDIETYFTPPVKTFRSGKNFIVRCDVYSILGKPQVQVFDEKEVQIQPENISPSDLTASIIEIKGIKCSSRSFHLMLEVKQLLKIVKTDIFSTCLIKRNDTSGSLDQTVVSHDTTSVESSDSDEQERSAKPIIKPVENITPDTEPTDNVAPAQENIEEPAETSEQENIEEPAETSEQENIEDPEYIENNVVSEETELPINVSTEEPSHLDPEPSVMTESEPEPGIEGLGEEIDINELIIDEPEEIQEENEYNLVNAVEVDITPSDEVFEIMDREKVYYNLYKDARRRAKEAKEAAMAAYLEANNIKNTYMLEDTETDSDDDLDIMIPK